MQGRATRTSSTGGAAPRASRRPRADGEITALYLFQTDPVRDLPDRTLWNRALDRAGLVVAHASILTEGLREHATVVFPAESYAEKEGTVVHPDGRLQRLRTAIAHPGGVRAGWSVIAEVARRVGLDTRVLTSSMLFTQLVDAVPFYGGLTLEQIGGQGVRWPERPQASAMPAGINPGAGPAPLQAGIARGRQAPAGGPPQAARSAADEAESGGAQVVRLRLGRYHPIWAAPEVDISPALKFAVARQQVELSPEDAQRAGIVSGETVDVSQNGNRLKATAAVRSDAPPGTAFLAEGLATDSANALTEPTIEIAKI